MRVRVLDLETTGTEPDAAVCEIGYCDIIRNDDGTFVVEDPVSWLCNPGRPIPPEAMAVHHITNEMVNGFAPFSSWIPALRRADDELVMFGAHNYGFEQGFFDAELTPWACSYKAALRHWPDAPAHKLQVLRYWLGIDAEEGFKRDHVTAPHRAGADAYLGALILRRLFVEVGGKQVAAWTREPALMPRVTFGKHKGKRWSDKSKDGVPDSYIDWLITKATDLDDDVLDTARHHAHERGII